MDVTWEAACGVLEGLGAWVWGERGSDGGFANVGGIGCWEMEDCFQDGWDFREGMLLCHCGDWETCGLGDWGGIGGVV